MAIVDMKGTVSKNKPTMTGMMNETPKTVDTSILTKDITKQTKDLVTKEPEFGALTEAEKQTAIAIKGDKPDYYSRIVKAISDSKQSTMSAKEWKGVIGTQGTKDEMDFLGLTEKLQGDKSITKEDLLDPYLEKLDEDESLISKEDLLDLKIDYGQGYLFGAPKPAEIKN